MLAEKYNPYEELSEELDENEQNRALIKAISELFEMVNRNEPLNIGLARYVLRRSSAKRIRSIYPPLINNIAFFFPVIKDVYQYIRRVHHERFNSILKDKIFEIINSKRWNRNLFIKYWMYDFIVNFREIFSAHDALRCIDSESDIWLKSRYRPLFSRAFNDQEWIRSQREIWQNTSPWAQRAYVYSISILPFDERKHWLASIKQVPDISLRYLANAVYNL